MVDTCRLTVGADPRRGMGREMVQIDYLVPSLHPNRGPGVYLAHTGAPVSFAALPVAENLQRFGGLSAHLLLGQRADMFEHPQVDLMHNVIAPQAPVDARPHPEFIPCCAA